MNGAPCFNKESTKRTRLSPASRRKEASGCVVRAREDDKWRATAGAGAGGKILFQVRFTLRLFSNKECWNKSRGGAAGRARLESYLMKNTEKGKRAPESGATSRTGQTEKLFTFWFTFSHMWSILTGSARFPLVVNFISYLYKKMRNSANFPLFPIKPCWWSGSAKIPVLY